MTDPRARRVKRMFHIALWVKGLDGAAELIGAAVLLTVPSVALHHVVAGVLARDLLGPPDGALARHFAVTAESFASGSRTFAVVYLAAHGLIKLALVAGLLREWLPAYPAAVVVLSGFVVFEVVRAVGTGSVVLPFLAMLDIAVIVLVVKEYGVLRRRRNGRIET